LVHLHLQGTLNLGNVEKCDRTGEFCRVVSRMLLTSRGSFDGYLVHYNQKDKAQWAVKMGSDGEDKARALVVDPADGNIVVFGYYSGIARFGHMTMKSTMARLDCAHGCAAFVAKYLKNGKALWVQQLGLGTHVGPQDQSTKASIAYWAARSLEFMKANPEPEFNLDFYSDKRKTNTILRNPEDLEKFTAPAF